MSFVTVDKFLFFWNLHNTAIIEGLIGLVVIFCLFLAYRSFFSKSAELGEAGSSSNVDTAQLEKTLQKILENQAGHGKSSAGSSSSEDLGTDLDISSMESAQKKGAAGSDEVAKLRSSLSNSQKEILDLQAQLKEAQSQAAAAGSAAGLAGGSGGGSDSGSGSDSAASAALQQEKDDLQNRLRDMEARLAEYEIISEDIADLSRYREENEQLKREIENLNVRGGGTQVVLDPAPGTPQAKIEIETPRELPKTEPTPEELAAAMSQPVIDPQAEPEPVVNDLIDDELMKEFAAAVEGQKSASSNEKEPPVAVDANKEGSDNENLMNEFENFVAKKS